MAQMDATVDRQVDYRMALAAEWDALVEQARNLPGLEDFMRPPRLASLLPATAGGSVVIVNVSMYRCDALIVDAGGVQVVELDGLTAGAVVMQAERYLDGIERFERSAQQAYVARQRIGGGDNSFDARNSYRAAAAEFQDQRATMERMLTDILSWLWDAIAEPVLTRLGFDGTPADGRPWPRVWWYPTGPLTLLPLHAAGHHESGQVDAPRTVIDRVVSSYTPTLRALSEAVADRSEGAQPGGPGKLLVVAVGDAAGQPPLPSMLQERDVLIELLGAPRVTLLEGAAATRARVLAALASHRWVHFSCHGDQNLQDPSSGGLFLHDGMLAIRDVAAGYHRGEFAFLSACKTATGGVDLPDEAITLAAALHYTGFRHVIATLWSVYDSTAASVATTVYEQLTTGGRFAPQGAACALHKAVRELRDLTGNRPSAWIPFTHTGP